MKKYFYILTLIILITSCKENKASFTKTVSKIEKEKVISNTVIDEEEIENDDSFPNNKLLASVLKQLKIPDNKCKYEFTSINKSPYNDNESIIIIPEIVIAEDESQYFELNTHIVLVNSETGKIKKAYFESNKTNGWISDALYITDIEIDSTLYKVNNDTKAFGVRIQFMGSSKPNPYSSEHLSLFIPKANSLQKILDYEIADYVGEWDMDCTGEFYKKKCVLRPLASITNGFYDLSVASEYTTTTNFVNKDGACESKNVVSYKTSKLVFSEGKYKKKTP